jgi:transcriptional regulator with XRE-family HTH domain
VVTEEVPFNVVVGLAIRRIRRERDLSQEELAMRAGVSSRHLGELERGQKDPRVTTIAAVVEQGFAMSFADFALICSQMRDGTPAGVQRVLAVVA